MAPSSYNLPWIKVRTNILTDPDLMRLARMWGTQARVEDVLGYVIKFWIWAQEHSADGHIKGVTMHDIDVALATPNLCQRLFNVGWLEQIEDTNGSVVIVPKFDRHLSEGAKARALAAERQRKSRSKKSVTFSSRSKRDKSVTRGEESRVELKESKPKKGGPKRPCAPTIDEVHEYFSENDWPQREAIDFFEFYESNGWKQGNGKKPIVKWKLAASRWHRRQDEFRFGTDQPKHEGSFYQMDKTTKAELERARLFKAGRLQD